MHRMSLLVFGNLSRYLLSSFPFIQQTAGSTHLDVSPRHTSVSFATCLRRIESHVTQVISSNSNSNSNHRNHHHQTTSTRRRKATCVSHIQLVSAISVPNMQSQNTRQKRQLCAYQLGSAKSMWCPWKIA